MAKRFSENFSQGLYYVNQRSYKEDCIVHKASASLGLSPKITKIIANPNLLSKKIGIKK